MSATATAEEPADMATAEDAVIGRPAARPPMTTTRSSTRPATPRRKSCENRRRTGAGAAAKAGAVTRPTVTVDLLLSSRSAAVAADRLVDAVGPEPDRVGRD